MYMIKSLKENPIIAGLGALKPILVELQVHMHAFLNIHLGLQDDQKLKNGMYLKEWNLNVCRMDNIKIPITSLLWSKNMLFLMYNWPL